MFNALLVWGDEHLALVACFQWWGNEHLALGLEEADKLMRQATCRVQDIQR